MGVPKFFRWVAERYPSVITPFRDFPPPVDNLYLDMNGIIHNCTHPNDADATHKAPTEKAMVEAMFSYLEKLFNAIQPRKCFFLAVDGVAPRAKMNQQRQRRYRSGYEMMVAREEALSRGEELPEEADVFDSNCITPGTDFMVRISEHFQYFIMMKMSTDPAWQNCSVIYSGHDHPGEGEHKIVEFIRRRKMQPDYGPNETHCMYGLDADLVMLALATHEPHFVLLREVVTFGFGQESRRAREQREQDESDGIVADKSYQKPDEFVLFHVNVLRDYLDLEVRERLGDKLPTNYDLERVVDDFVLMCFFIGNDFLPSIPTLGIHDGSLVQMLDLYAQRVLLAHTYLTDMGRIDWRAVEGWLQGLADLEFTTIKAREAQEQEYQRRMAQQCGEHRAATISTSTVESLREYKDRYYRDKHQFAMGWDPQGEDMAKLRLHYIEGIMWVIGYYYQGPPSWKWYFPHHYAPMASDLVNLPAVAACVKFDPGKPFLPHQQLLAVLPPMSYRSMPRAYWPLLRSKNSPLARYFPEKLQIDREGTRAPWEGVVLIPFIEERTLLAAYETVQDRVTPEERENNRLGLPTLYAYDPTIEAYEVPNSLFGPLRRTTVRRDAFDFPPLTKFIPRLCTGVCTGEQQFEGFTTLRSKWRYITPQRESGVVTIFGMPARGESLLLGLKDSFNAIAAHEVATLVGQEVLVGFPHYRRARVVAVSDKRVHISANINLEGVSCGANVRELNRDASMNIAKELETHRQCMREKLGMSVSNLTVLVYVNLFTGMRMTRKGRVVRNFSKDQTCYALPLVARLQDVKLTEDSRYVERDRVEWDNRFGSRVILVGAEPKSMKGKDQQLYGSSGVVVRSSPDAEGTFTVAARVFQKPVSIPHVLLDYASSRNWVSMPDVSNEVRVGPSALKHLVGSVRTSPQYGCREIGLGLIYTRNNLVRIGYAKQTVRGGKAWGAPGGRLGAGLANSDDAFGRPVQDAAPAGHYLESLQKGESRPRSSRPMQYMTWFSRKAVVLIKTYVERFKPLVDRLESIASSPQALDPPQFMTGEWADNDVDDVLRSIEEFIESCGIQSVPLVAAQDDAFPREHVRMLEEELDRQGPRPLEDRILSSVARRCLYFPVTRCAGGHISQLPLPQEQTVHLGSRVVNCRACGAAPFGATGTVVRLLSTGHDAEVVYDDPFVGGSYFDGRLRQPRGSISKLSTLLVLNKPSGDESESPQGQNGSVVQNLKSICKKLQQKEVDHDQQRQHGRGMGIPSTEGTPSIPKPRSAMGETSASGIAAGRNVVSPSSLTVSGGSGGIQVAELMGKLASSKATSPDAGLNICGATSAATVASNKLPVAPRSVTTTAAPGSGTFSVPLPRTSGNANRTNSGDGEGDKGCRKPGFSFTVPSEVLNGEFQIRPGEGALLLKRMISQHLSGDRKR
ncbi:5'-3' exoribonuclease A [Trypanosoma brucei equiperdum]|uniref:5'-3' exoribonuclease 2 n=1 Tax=Trypanosoma brucei equiperdum TaxID=630700 RepID=A0A3L6L810_9TRYP|nr:5'-3' exoribonuclease A [Trypanosoma brucei equiperdum]